FGWAVLEHRCMFLGQEPISSAVEPGLMSGITFRCLVIREISHRIIALQGDSIGVYIIEKALFLLRDDLLAAAAGHRRPVFIRLFEIAGDILVPTGNRPAIMLQHQPAVDDGERAHIYRRYPSEGNSISTPAAELRLIFLG